MTDTTIRRDFEAWAVDRYKSDISRNKHCQDIYADPEMDTRWVAWQAATERAAKVCDQIARDSEESARNSIYEKSCDDCAAAIRRGGT